MPTGVATVTAKTGPGRQITGKVINRITSFNVDILRQIFTVSTDAAAGTPGVEYDLTGVTTFTVAIANGNFTLTVS